MKQKTCKQCGELFEPERPFQKCCGFKCAIEYAKDQREKKESKELKVRVINAKPRSYWIKRAQAAFNAYIRQRDADQPCISCQRHHAGQYHAGHYRTVGSCPELRFDEDNCHKQCAPCNNHLSGNLVKYRVNLIFKIGIERVEWLEGNHEATHYSIDDIKQIEKTYKEKLKKLIKT